MKPNQNGKGTTPKAPGADIVINATPNELRVALIEEGRLAEIYLDVPDKQRTVGSIYLGRVQKVLQGMNAAFVDIGLDQDAFLHFSDVGSAFDEFREFLDGDDDDDEKGAEEGSEEKGKPSDAKGKVLPKENPKEKKGDVRQGKDGKKSDAKQPERRDEKPKEVPAAEAEEAPSTEEGTEADEQNLNGAEGKKKRRRGRRGGRRRRKQREGMEGEGAPEQGEGTAQPARDERRNEPHRPAKTAEAPRSEREKRPNRDERGTEGERPAAAAVAATPAPEAPAPKRTSKRAAAATEQSDEAPAPAKRPARRTAKSEAAQEAETTPAPTRSPRKRSAEPEGAEPEAEAPAKRRATRAKKEATAEEGAEAPAPAKRRATRAKKSDDGDAPVRSNTVASALPTFQTKRSGTITIALERGQDIMVQVTRESYSSKGVRVASKISLPGRFLVLLPLDSGIGISRKVQSEKERRRLRRIARSILPEGHGCIIRTVAEGRDEEVIRQDLTTLVERWKTIEERVRQTEPPALLYRESSIAGSMMRDLLTRDVGRIMIDNREMYDALTDYVAWAAPWMVGNVHLHTGPQPVFEQYGVERELERMMEPKIYTPSGGYIIIDRTEAMTVIDVNSGRFVGKKDQEQNALKTNLEAAREIARQLRLRDVGGLIVVDFIDLDDERNRKKVCDELKREMRNDKAKSVVLPMTQFGIVQMTRQRIRQQVVETLTQSCPCCNGTGSLRSRSVAARALERWLERFRAGSREQRLALRAHPDLVSYLSEGEGVGSRLTEIMRRTKVDLNVVPDTTVSPGAFHLLSLRSGADITREFARDKRGHTATPLPPYVLPPGVAPLEEERRSERGGRGEKRRDERRGDGENAEAGKEERKGRKEEQRKHDDRRGQQRNGRDDRRNQQRGPHQPAQAETQPAEAPAAVSEAPAQTERREERPDRRRDNRRGGRGGRKEEAPARPSTEAHPEPAPAAHASNERPQPETKSEQPAAEQKAPKRSTRGGGRSTKAKEPAAEAQAPPPSEPAAPEAKPKRKPATRAKKSAEGTEPAAPAEAGSTEKKSESPKRTARAPRGTSSRAAKGSGKDA